MALVWNERFTGTGYDETWSAGESVGVSSVVDEDTATPTGGIAPGFSGNCLKIVHTGNEANVRNDWGSGLGKPITYWRKYVICASIGDVDNQLTNIIRTLDQGGAQAFKVQWKRRSAGAKVRLNLVISDDGSDTTFETIDLDKDTQYLLETKYDATGNAWSWKVDGSTEGSGTLTGSPSEIRSFRLGEFFGSADNATHYIDSFAIDDAEWIGAVVGAFPAHYYQMMRG